MNPKVYRGSRIVGCLLLLLTFVLGFQARPANAAGTAATNFYEGALDGDDIVDWTLWLGRSGSQVLGLTYGTGGPAPDDALIGARMEGRIKRNKVTLKVYPIVARNRRSTIGKLTGTISGNTITGTFTMAGRQGTFSATLQDADLPEMQEYAGLYEGETDAGDLQLSLSRKGTFVLSGNAFGEEIFRAIGGWLITPDGQLWVLPVSLRGNNSFFEFTLKFRAPFALSLEENESGFSVREPIRSRVVAHFRRK